MIAARPESNTGAATPTDEAMTSNPLHLHVVTLLPGVRSKYPAISKYPRRPRIGARTAPASPGPPDPLLPPVGQRDHSRLRSSAGRRHVEEVRLYGAFLSVTKKADGGGGLLPDALEHVLEPSRA